MVEKPLIIARVVLAVEARGKTEVRQLDVPILVDQNVVGFDVSMTMLNKQMFSETNSADVQVREALQHTDE